MSLSLSPFGTEANIEQHSVHTDSFHILIDRHYPVYYGKH